MGREDAIEEGSLPMLLHKLHVRVEVVIDIEVTRLACLGVLLVVGDVDCC